MTPTPPAIVVRDVHKSFAHPRERMHTLKERVLHPLRNRRPDAFRALAGVDFEVGRGEFFGIVGRNGSGKSTLLKCMAGIYRTDSGVIEVDGRLSPFIELGVGFNPDLTARDNVMINAIMLGLSRRQARERFDDIIRFAELEDFLDLKLKNYSSGMNVRLAFSVAIQVDADVVLVDEVLAVGDAAFQHKCYERFQALKDAGKTIVFVTHDMHAVERFCDRAMLIERGEVLEIGAPERIARLYNQVNFGRVVPEEAEGLRRGDHTAAEIVTAWFEDAAGERITAFEQGGDLRLCAEVTFRQDMEDPVFGLSLRNEVGHTVFATSTAVGQPRTGRFTAGDTVVARTELTCHFAPSTYKATWSIARSGAPTDLIDLREDLASCLVHARHFSGGLVDLPHRFEVARA